MRSPASKSIWIGCLIAWSFTVPLSFADSTTSFDFSQNGIGNLTNRTTFTAGSYSITAYGFADKHVTSDLFFKDGSGDERGLGLTGHNAKNEIADSAFIEFSNITGTHLNLSLSFGSVQIGESWNIYCSNELGDRGSLISSGNFEGEVDLTRTAEGCKFISVGAGLGDVLFSDMQLETVVPEPDTSILTGTGMAALVAVVSVKRRSARPQRV